MVMKFLGTLGFYWPSYRIYYQGTLLRKILQQRNAVLNAHEYPEYCNLCTIYSYRAYIYVSLLRLYLL